MNNAELSPNINLPELLGRPGRGIIFSDLDGVWLDEDANFRPPPTGTLTSIARARNLGYWVVLTSDTAPSTLIDISRGFGMNNWVVAENGSVLASEDMGIISRLGRASDIPSLRQRCIDRLMHQANTFVWQGDATQFVQKEEKIPGLPPGQTVYLVNIARVASIGIYTRTVDSDGSLYVDNAQTQHTYAMLQSILEYEPIENRLVCKQYPVVGSCLLKDPTVRKVDAVQRIIRQFGAHLSFWMIGDTCNDSMEELAGLVRIGAVANAQQSLKNEAMRLGGIVAPDGNAIAYGAQYIIEKIIETEGP